MHGETMTMSERSLPTFTIIIPVWNGGKYLKQCVESILAQTYTNFELVLVDNASDDTSVEYISHLEQSQENVKVFRSLELLTIEKNWERILSIPKKEFLTIIGHDDIFHPHFLSDVATLISDFPEGTLYSTHFNLIDSQGNTIRPCKPIPKFEAAHEYLASRLCDLRDSFGTGFVMRSKDYDDVGGIPLLPNLLYADDNLWIKLIKDDVKITSSNISFSYRLHESSTSGKPNKVLLFNALITYLEFLRGEAARNNKIDQVIKRYSDKYISARCKEYFFSLDTHQKEYGIEIAKIKSIMKMYDCSEKIETWQAMQNSYMHVLKARINRMLKRIKTLAISPNKEN
jgi:glycosyltransferase involved in cell wall biosynthesis